MVKLLTFSSAQDRTGAGNDHLILLGKNWIAQEQAMIISNIEFHVIGKELDHTSGAGTDLHHHDMIVLNIGKEYDC